MLDRLMLLRRLRQIWFRAVVVTPTMIVDTIKVIYSYITGKSVCLFLVLCCTLPNANAGPIYRLARPKTESSYLLGKSPAPPKTKPSTATRLSEKRSTVSDKADALVVVSATWCNPCKRLYPVIKRLAASGYDAKVVYEAPKGARVTAYPTLLYYKNGKLVYTQVGVQTEAEIKRRLSK